LNKQVDKLIAAVRRELPDNILDTNCNGDKLTVQRIKDLYAAGLTAIYVNLYDGPEQKPKFEALFAEAGADPERFRLRPHWGGPDEDYGLILNNRSGMVTSAEAGMEELDEPIMHPCYYPFSRLLVDWNGDVLLCSNDWGRAVIAGNVNDQSLREIWMSDTLFEYRRKLMHGDRRHKPCNKCNVAGTLSGQFSFDLLIDHYREQGAIRPDEVPAKPRTGTES
jgi:radical SAM protein with 4Fe4S-binding SPASM domain